MYRLLLLLAVIAWVLSACASLQPAGDRNTELPVPSQWKLFSFSDPNAETPVIEGSEITLSFAENGQLGGNGGCNSYGGQYELQGTALTISELNSTLVACADEAVTAQEQQYFQALQSASELEFAGDNLYIRYAGGQSQLSFIADNAE